MDKSALLRGIPKVDELLRRDGIAALSADYSRGRVADAVRGEAEALRQGILSGEMTALPDAEALCAAVRARLEAEDLLGLRPVINATGTVLHTNLGRASLSERAATSAAAVASAYSTLEYDLASGGRGERCAHVETLLQKLTGAESALAVNNNASAVLLILTALGKGREAVVSRGELVEIGGSFRVPEIMEQCGCRLREAGTTNKTHPKDYIRAIGPDTCALMKVHTSNFRIVGFTASVGIEKLREIADAHGLPVIYDMGSGSLLDPEAFGIRGEPTVQASLKAGADIVCFSGDKLLGGPQAGIIVGQKKYLDIFKSHPLMRAVRLDKMALAALEATLLAYLDPENALRELPVLRMLSETPDSLRPRAEKLRAMLAAAGARCEIIPEKSQVGGGSVPAQLLDTLAVAVFPGGLGADALETRLRKNEPPVICRIAKDRCLFDLRTLDEGDFETIAEAVGRALA